MSIPLIQTFYSTFASSLTSFPFLFQTDLSSAFLCQRDPLAEPVDYKSFVLSGAVEQKKYISNACSSVLLRKLEVWPFKFMDLTTQDFKRKLIPANTATMKIVSLWLYGR